MKQMVTVFFLMLALSACGRAAISQNGFYPVAEFPEREQERLTILQVNDGKPKTKFYFIATADAIYPAGDAEAEARRMKRLSEHISEGGHCPSGHEIVLRQERLKTEGLLGKIVNLRYRVICNDS
ncbi:MAG: hypothetical protein AB8B85_07095 [Paracoccaceae bacterium]